MEPYAIYIHLELLEAVPASGEQRKKIMTFIRSLGEHPQTPGDLTDKDASLRTRQIKIIGHYAITSKWGADKTGQANPAIRSGCNPRVPRAKSVSSFR